MKKTLFVFCLLCLSTFLIAQQQIAVKGKVTDADNIGVPGVSVLIKGSSEGTITDLNGDYSLNVSSDAILIFSYIGFISQEVAVNNQETINIVLQESTELIDEIVVVGYGEMKRGDLTSAMVSVKSEELVKSQSGQTMQALQGKVAGVQIVSAGAPGSEPTVRIRGIGSYPGISDSKPLYVVDGTFFDNIDFLNPSDIETLSVLKDASASAIYGVRAANGVVLITTKKGSLSSKSTITYSGYYGVQVPQNVLKMANSEQFVNYVNQIDQQVGPVADAIFIENAMQRFGRSRVNPNVPDVNTDWYAEVMRASASQQNHSLSVLGGNEKTAYALGVGYFEQEGLLKTENSYKRLNLRVKLDHKANDWFKTGINVNLSNGTRYVADDRVWFDAYHAVPVMPVYDDENYNEIVAAGEDNPSRYSSAQLLGYRERQNPFTNLDYKNERQDIRKVLTGAYGQIDFIPNKLMFKTNYNVFFEFTRIRKVELPFFISNGIGSSRIVSSLESERNNIVNQFLDNTLTYTESFGNHNLTAMIGVSYRDEWEDKLIGKAQDFPLDENSWYIDQSDPASRISEDAAERFYGLSYFGRIAYNFNNKYLAYVTLRRDGTSKYQETWGTFPAFGLGWVVSEEGFFKGISFVDYLKIRGGWGKLGNDKIPSEDGENTTSFVEYLAINDILTSGTTTTSTFGYLDWETVTGTNIGITAAFLDNRLNLEADYYIRDTENAVIPVNLLLQAGEVRRNVGVIRNSGLEVALNWNGKIGGDINYTVGANFATITNEVRDIYGQAYINAGSAEFRQRTLVGEPLLSFYGYEVAGVYQNQAEIDADPIAVDNGLVPGDLKYVDQDNNDVLDDEDNVVLGSYIPTLIYGANIGLSYKNFEFSMYIMGQMGNKILNRKRAEIKWINDQNIDAHYANGLWNGEGTSDKYPSASGLRRGWNNNQLSSLWLEDGAFFRIQNIQVAYNLKGAKLLGVGMPDVRVYFTAEKPYTRFNYNGFNPEVPDGIDSQFYPVPALYTFGLNLKF